MAGGPADIELWGRRETNENERIKSEQKAGSAPFGEGPSLPSNVRQKATEVHPDRYYKAHLVTAMRREFKVFGPQ